MSVMPELKLGPTYAPPVRSDPRAVLDASAGARARLPGVRAASLSVLTPLSGRDTGLGRHGVRVSARSDEDRVRPCQSRLGRLLPDVRHCSCWPDARSRRAIARHAVKVARDQRGRCQGLLRPALSDRRDAPIRTTTASYQIVGIVRDSKHMSVRDRSPRFVFLPLWQPLDTVGRITLAVASDQPTPTLVRAVTREVHGDSLEHADLRRRRACRIRSTRRWSASGCSRRSPPPLRRSRSDWRRSGCTAC